MEMLTIDLRAADSWNTRANELVSAVVLLAGQKDSEGWRPDLVPTASLTERDVIGEPDVSVNSLDGARMSLDFVTDGGRYTLRGDGYRKLTELCKIVLKTRSVKQYIATKTVEDLLRNWVRARFRDQSFQEFSTFFLSECNGRINRFHVWIPIMQLHVEHSFPLGAAVVHPIDKPVIENIVRDKTQDWRDKMQQKLLAYQGHSAAAIYVEGDVQRAREIALEKTERVLAALSLLTPAAINCNIVTGAALWGSRNYSAASAFFFVDGSLRGISEGVIGPTPLALVLNAKALAEFEPLLKALHLVLVADEPNSFSESVVDALLVYRRTMSSPDPAEKLIYVFVALEMIFLRNSNEPIQDNVATRIAFLIGNSVEERRSIISVIKDGYALRSAFIHHGVAVTDTSAADSFLQTAWRAIFEAVNATRRFSDRDKLIQFLEDRKLQ